MTRFKIALAASAALAITTLSCSDDGDSNSSGGSSYTEAYKLTINEDNTFNLVSTEIYYRCRDNGVLEEQTSDYPETYNYSVANNVLTMKYRYSNDDDTLHFNGKSDKLAGTWTRKKDKATSCKPSTDYPDEIYCKEGYNWVKAEFTQNTAKITIDRCWTDRQPEEMDIGNGWKEKVAGCNSIEYVKGTEKVKVTQVENRTSGSVEVSYKGKSCKASYKDHSKSERQSACTKAWNKNQTEPNEDWNYDYYYDFLYATEEKTEENLNKCIVKMIPASILSEIGYDGDEEDDD